MPIHHVSIITSDASSISKFYDAALAPLGYKTSHTFNEGKVIGYSDKCGPSFWIHSASDPSKAGQAVHIAFTCNSQEEVQAFHAAALAAGAKDNGAPGYRPYVEGYYAAFALDPEGRNLEAVHFVPAPPAPEA